MRIFWKKKKL